MEKDSRTVMDVLLEALKKSKGKTIDFVVEHGVLKGINMEMMEWWLINQSVSDRYSRWYPEDHISFRWKVAPNGNDITGSIGLSEERIGEYAASILHMRAEDPPGWSSISDENGTRVGWIHEDFEETPNGLMMRSTFRFPEKTPKKFLKAMHKHNFEEMARLTDFLPWIYRLAVNGE